MSTFTFVNEATGATPAVGGAGIASGHHVYLIVQYAGTGNLPTGVADSQGQTYQVLANKDGQGSLGVAIYRKANSVALIAADTITYTGGSVFRTYIYDATGVLGGGVVAGTGGANSGSSSSFPVATTTGAPMKGDIVIAAYVVANGVRTLTPAGGVDGSRTTSANFANMGVQFILSAAADGAQTLSMGIDAASPVDAVIVAIPSDAFPSIATVVDDFNRANGAVGANWSANPFNTGAPAFDIVSNTIRPVNNNNDMWWNAAQYGPDLEARISLPTWDGTANGKGLNIAARIASPSAAASTANGYVTALYVNTADATFDTIESGKYVNSAYTRLGISTTTLANLATNDEVAFQVVRTILRTFRKPSGGIWGLEMALSDATYNNAGFIALHGDNATFRFDNFIAGSVASGAVLDLEYEPNRLALRGAKQAVKRSSFFCLGDKWARRGSGLLVPARA